MVLIWVSAFFDKAEEEKKKISGVGLLGNCGDPVRKPYNRSDGFSFYLVHRMLSQELPYGLSITGRNSPSRFNK